LDYTEPLLRAAVFAFWRRTVGVGFLVALGVVFGAWVFLLWQGDRSWVVGLLGAVLGFGGMFAVVVYLVHLRQALAKFRAMGAPTATWSMDDASFTLASGLGSTSLAWSSIVEVWRYPAFWLVLFSKAQFVTLPVAALPDDVRAFILDRVAAAGGKVVG
jgi:hypothetical protein